MATRCYLRSSGTPAITPAYNGGSIVWDSTGSASRYPLSKVQGETGFVSVGIGRGTGDGSAFDVLVGQWVSAAIGAQSFTTSQTFKGQVQAFENFGSADMRLQVVIWVAKADGTSRGVLYSGDAVGAIDSHEFVVGSTFTNRKLAPTTTPTSFTGNVTAVNGDFLVVEVGYRSYTSSSSRTGTLEIGGNSGTDLSEDETDANQRNPWIEFSFTLVDASSGHTVTLTQPAETDSATAFTGPKKKTLAQPAETDSATTMAAHKGRQIVMSQPSETDMANAMKWAPKKRLAHQIVETDSASVMTPSNGGGGSFVDPMTDLLVDYEDGTHDGEDASISGWDVSGRFYILSGAMAQTGPEDAGLFITDRWADDWGGESDDTQPDIEAYAKFTSLPPAIPPVDTHDAFFGIEIRVKTDGGSGDEAVFAGVGWDDTAGDYYLALIDEPEIGHIGATVIGDKFYFDGLQPTGDYYIWVKSTGFDYELRYTETSDDGSAATADYPSSPQCAGTTSDTQRIHSGIGFGDWQIPQDQRVISQFGGGLLTGAPIRTIGQPTETDTSSAFLGPKKKAFAQPSETDTAQVMTRVHSRTMSQPAESDSATAFVHPKTLHMVQPAETDSATHMTPRRAHVFNQPSEADTANAFSHFRTLHLTQPAETDSANAFTRIRKHVISQPSETDSALTFSHTKRKTMAQPAETDSANAMTEHRSRTLSQPSETDSATTFTHGAKITLGQPAETDQALSITLKGSTIAHTVNEADTANAISCRKIHPFGQPSETDVANAFSHARKHAFGLSLETDSVPSMRAVRGRNITQPNETDSANSFVLLRKRAIGQPVETDTANVFKFKKTGDLGRPVETDTATHIVSALPHLQTGAETDSATRFFIPRRLLVARETDSAKIIRPLRHHVLGMANEFDSVVAVGHVQHPTQPAEDTLLAVGDGAARLVGVGGNAIHLTEVGYGS